MTENLAQLRYERNCLIAHLLSSVDAQQFVAPQTRRTKRKSQVTWDPISICTDPEVNLDKLHVENVLACLRLGRKLDLNNAVFWHDAGSISNKLTDLDDVQLNLAAFECVLLCTTLKSKSDDESMEMRIVRSNLEISKKIKEQLLTGLKVHSKWPTQSLMYRVDLLLAKRPEHFETDFAFETFVERQLWVVYNGIKAILDVGSAKHGIDAESIIKDLTDYTTQVWEYAHPQDGSHRFRRSEGFPKESYKLATIQFAEFIEQTVLTTLSDQMNLVSNGMSCAFPLNIKLYSPILLSLFDEEGASLIQNINDVVDALTPLRIGLAITDNLHELALTVSCFKRYQKFKNISSLMTFESKLSNSMKVDAAQGWGAEEAKQLQTQAQTLFLEGIAKEIVNDYELLVVSNPPKELHVLVNIYSTLAQQNSEGNRQLSFEESKDGCIVRLMQQVAMEHYSRQTFMCSRPLDTYSLPEVASIIANFFPKLKKQTVSVLGEKAGEHLIDAVVEALHTDIRVMQPAPIRVMTLTEAGITSESPTDVSCGVSLDLFKALAAVQDAEIQLGVSPSPNRRCLSQLLEDPKSPIAIMLHDWAESLDVVYSMFLGRILTGENWEPMMENVRHSTSVVDIFCLLAQTLELYFTMKTPLPHLLLQILNEMVSTIMAYSMSVKALIGQSSEIVPKNPKLRRSYRGKVPEIPTYINEEWYSPTVQQTLEAQPLRQCVVMLNNLHVLTKKATMLWFSIKERWAELCLDRDAVAMQSTSEIDSLRNALLMALDHNVSESIEYVAARVAFFEMRESFLGGLYVPSVVQSRIHGVLGALDAVVLPAIADHILSELAQSLFLAIGRNCLGVYERVIFNGGTHRLFVIEDAKMMEEDVRLLVEYFAPNDGSGIPPAAFSDLKDQLLRCMVTFQMTTKNLISICEQNSKDKKQQEQTRLSDPFCGYNVLRVLAHRDDKEAFSYMKKAIQDFSTGSVARPVMEVLDMSSRLSYALKEGPSMFHSKQASKAQETAKTVLRVAPEERIRAANVGEGLYRGIRSFGTELFAGVAGVVVEPIAGAGKDGARGFFKGMGKGISGVALRPLAGVVDLVTSTSEGLINTPGAMIDAAKGVASRKK